LAFNKKLKSSALLLLLLRNAICILKSGGQQAS